MRGILIGAAVAVLALTGCETTPTFTGDREAVTIPYDPYDYDPDQLQEQADAHCGAYGRDAHYEDETIDPSSVRWRYRHYRCV